MPRIWPLLLILMAGCGSRSGPATTDTSSESIAELSDRIEFLHRYLTFRRNYRELDFHIVYQNNGGGMVPGPSEWDIRLVAVVPHEELELWIPSGVKPIRSIQNEWLAEVPNANRASGVAEWYVDGLMEVGINRVNSVVAYRIWKR
jgi:hypothetical protein